MPPFFERLARTNRLQWLMLDAPLSIVNESWLTARSLDGVDSLDSRKKESTIFASRGELLVWL
jgi:hypothetical protein